jgi:hypothetical protein
MSVCPSCRAHLEPALPLCVACGRSFPEQEPATRGLVVRRPPEDQRSRVEVQQLLAAASGQSESTVARYVDKGRALFRLPSSEAIAGRLHDHLVEAGADVELTETVGGEVAWGTWARALWNERPSLLMLWLGAGALTGYRRPNLLLLWMLISGVLAVLDVRGFGRRITLSPVVLARRLGLVSGSLARPAGAILRRARSGALRGALGAALVEHAKLLSAVAHALRGHPALQIPFRETLDEVGEHTLRIAENAVAIEEAGDAEAGDLPARLADLRALGSEETDRQLKALLVSRDERRARHEWLRQAHALLLIRLEAITERLRGLRQETAQRVLELNADAASADRSLESLGRELELAATALKEVERDLPQALPEVIAEVITPRG